MSLVKILIINLLKSRRTLLFLCVQTIAFFLYATLLRFYHDLYLDEVTLSLYNVNTVENNILSYYGIGIYFITGGILLWSFILIEQYVSLRANDHSGILLTQIVNPITRTGYFLRVMASIYFTYLFLTLINLILSVLIIMLLFQIFNLNLLLIALAAFLYICMFSLLIYLVFSLLCFLLKSNEVFLFTCSIIMLFSNFSFLLKFASLRYQVSKVFSTLINLNSDLFLFFMGRFNIFRNYAHPIYNWLSTRTGHFTDPDLGMIPSSKIKFIEQSEWLSFGVAFVIILVLFALNIKRFNKIDIAGH
ncbi:hypothetical protein [Haloplasma contractile]|uniref:Uncharacterized protein n=1 Tax=Haloplasma contractile SSD-17B TaxID=1033810 RepID=F7PVJ1_9MOLU|nr:hypothetical protein [Haloplasma contractile]ERJ12841.1 hypothetical protein HLPCO_001181 [Haloplasma contractile SSD-17B]